MSRLDDEAPEQHDLLKIQREPVRGTEQRRRYPVCSCGWFPQGVAWATRRGARQAHERHRDGSPQ